MPTSGQAHKFEGIVIRMFDAANNSLVVRIITPKHGKIVVLAPNAKNSRKRFGKLDIFDWGTFSVRPSLNNLPILLEFKNNSSFPELRDTHEKLTCATMLAEIADSITPENDPNSSNHFLTLKDFLAALGQAQIINEQLKLTHHYTYQLLQLAGFRVNSKLRTPTANNLKKLIHLCEESLEKHLNTTKVFYSIIKNR